MALVRFGANWSGTRAIFASAPADLFIAHDGQSMAVRGSDGLLVLLGDKLDEYTAEQWLLRDGDRRAVSVARAGAHCDEFGCVAKMKDGGLVALSLRVGAHHR
jgi:competence protein ComEC